MQHPSSSSSFSYSDPGYWRSVTSQSLSFHLSVSSNASIKCLRNRDLTSVLLVQTNVSLKLLHFLRKLLGVTLALSLLGHELDNCSFKFEDLVLYLSVL
jgi:hypothetical protein